MPRMLMLLFAGCVVLEMVTLGTTLTRSSKVRTLARSNVSAVTAISSRPPDCPWLSVSDVVCALAQFERQVAIDSTTATFSTVLHDMLPPQSGPIDRAAAEDATDVHRCQYL